MEAGDKRLKGSFQVRSRLGYTVTSTKEALFQTKWEMED